MKPQVALMRLEALCAQSEQCSCDVRQKLYRWGVSSSDSEKIVKQLIDNRFIEAEQIKMAIETYKELGIEIFVKYNNRKLMSGLIKAAGINEELIDSVIGVIDKKEKVTEIFSIISCTVQVFLFSRCFPYKTPPGAFTKNTVCGLIVGFILLIVAFILFILEMISKF